MPLMLIRNYFFIYLEISIPFSFLCSAFRNRRLTKPTEPADATVEKLMRTNSQNNWIPSPTILLFDFEKRAFLLVAVLLLYYV
jgi:hypothetical protein